MAKMRKKMKKPGHINTGGFGEDLSLGLQPHPQKIVRPPWHPPPPNRNTGSRPGGQEPDREQTKSEEVLGQRETEPLEAEPRDPGGPLPIGSIDDEAQVPDDLSHNERSRNENVCIWKNFKQSLTEREAKLGKEELLKLCWMHVRRSCR